ncbi:putative Flagellar transcriptional regulator FlhC|nr:putative Flagellar transcriptional regulator FlhC [Candidatus Pantoea persica]
MHGSTSIPASFCPPISFILFPPLTRQSDDHAMSEQSILYEVNDIHIAMALISASARMQVLESETTLSRRKLLRLYKNRLTAVPLRKLRDAGIGGLRSVRQ